jgi:hypothetical protein
LISVSLLIFNFAQAQSPTSAIAGEVVDDQGLAVRGVAITVTNTESKTRFVTESNNEGSYRLSALPIGRYTLLFTHAGFRTVEVADLDLHVGQERRADIHLTIARQAEAVNVTASLSSLDLQSSSNSRGVLKDEVQNLPLNGRQLQMFCLSWKWRGRSTVKITERTREKDTEALHGRREGRHPETTPAGAGADLQAV